MAGPLFILILLSVMTSFGSDARQVLILGYIVVIAVVPLAQAAFSYAIGVITPEA